jgi:transcriptional regulator with XRE-family HTH domain
VANHFRNQAVMKAFGVRIRELREAKGISQQELAYLCDWEYSQINRIELGKINTSISHVFHLAEKLDVTPSKLIDLDISQGKTQK